jgi:hypothetical protein
MTTRKSTKGQTTIYKKTKNKTKTKQNKTTQKREVNIEEDEPHKKPWWTQVLQKCKQFLLH